MNIRLGKKLKLRFRDAQLEDSETLSLIQSEYSEIYFQYEVPKTTDKFRIKIGSGILSGEKILVAEMENRIIGFIEQKVQSSHFAKIGYPFVIREFHDNFDVQKNLVKTCIDNLKGIGIKGMYVEFSYDLKEIEKLFRDLKFDAAKTIFQTWEGEILPLPTEDIEPFEIRKFSKKDIDITYSWIKSQLDIHSPLFITKESFKSFIKGPNSARDGWAIATYDSQPIAFVSSIIDVNSKYITIFGPFCDDNYVSARIPLLNELFLYYKLQGYDYARILRIKEIYNDEKLFNTFDFIKTEELRIMIKRL